jgi:hypothetical protein
MLMKCNQLHVHYVSVTTDSEHQDGKYAKLCTYNVKLKVSLGSFKLLGASTKKTHALKQTNLTLNMALICRGA